jgi:hypothetical protein
MAREADELTDIDAGPGDDVIAGGGDLDGVSYATRTASVAVRLDATGTGNGEAGEGDLISGVEDATGGAGNDLLVGNAAGNI